MKGFSKKQVTGFFITGAALGAAVGLLYAPKAGERTRKDIRRFSKRTVHQLDNLRQDLHGQVNDGCKQVMNVFDGMKDYVEDGRKKVQKIIRIA